MAYPTGVTAPMMSYHLASDIAHDHGLDVATDARVQPIIRSPINPPETDKEPEVLAFFDTILRSQPEFQLRLERTEKFELPPSTEMLPTNFKWSLLDAEKEEFGFVHDAGPLLFRTFGKECFVTYGSILDSATKPSDGVTYIPPPEVVPKTIFQQLGFSDLVGPMSLQPVAGSPNQVKCALTYGGVSYDMVSAARVGPVLAPKQMGKITGFLTSVATVRKKYEDRQFPLYVIGKAFGDALQVMAIPHAQGTTPVRLVHNSEDRLNVVRCKLYDIPIVYVGRPTNANPMRVCEFTPSSAMVRDTPESTYARYLAKLKELIQTIANGYNRVLEDAKRPPFAEGRDEYVKRFTGLVKYLKTGVLFHYALFHAYYRFQTPTPALVQKIIASYRILADQTGRLTPSASLFRANGQTLLQEMILCRARENDCDLGGFPFSEPGKGSDFSKETAEMAIGALFGLVPILSLKQTLRIDVQKLHAYLTEIGIDSIGNFLFRPGYYVSDSSGTTFGIRGTYKVPIVADKAANRPYPTYSAQMLLYSTEGGALSDVKVRTVQRIQPRGQQRRFEKALDVRKSIREEDVRQKRFGLESSDFEKNITSDYFIFRQYLTDRSIQADPEYIVRTIGGLERAAPDRPEIYDRIPDFGPVSTILYQFSLEPYSPAMSIDESAVSIWNEFVKWINTSILEHDASTPTAFTPLHPPPPSGGVRPPPPHGLSQEDWDDALDELEARYNK